MSFTTPVIFGLSGIPDSIQPIVKRRIATASTDTPAVRNTNCGFDWIAVQTQPGSNVWNVELLGVE